MKQKAHSFLDQSIGYLNHVVGLMLKREIIDNIKKSGVDITPEQWAVLNRLSEKSGLTQKELATATFKDAANITRIIDKLELKKLIKRKNNASDRRIWEIHITKQGEVIRNLIEPIAIAVLAKATENIDLKEIETFNKVSKKIIANLQR